MGEGGKCRRGRVGGGLICLRFATPFGQPKAGYLPSVGSRSDDGYFMGLVMLVGYLCDADCLFLFSVGEMVVWGDGAGDGAGIDYE
jgi:hypothetical protein